MQMHKKQNRRFAIQLTFFSCVGCIYIRYVSSLLYIYLFLSYVYELYTLYMYVSFLLLLVLLKDI